MKGCKTKSQNEREIEEETGGKEKQKGGNKNEITEKAEEREGK